MALYHINEGTILMSLLPVEEQKKYFCAKVNGRIKELTFPIPFEGDYEIEFLDLKSPEGARIYSSSIRYLASMAFKIVCPKMEIRFFYNISRAVFGKMVSLKKDIIEPELINKVKVVMEELIRRDIPFQRIRISKEEALKEYKRLGFKDKIDVLKFRKENYVHLYKAEYDSFSYCDYLYSGLVPSSGYLTKFKITPYAPGFLIQVPRSELNGEIPPFSDERKFAMALQESSLWEEKNELDTVSNINRFIKNYSALSLINISEARVNDMLASLGNRISSSKSDIRLICIAGPSSSGKTSFANRLMYELMSRGLRPIRISMDDYFIPQSELKPGTSFESVEAIDVEYFDRQMYDLISGKNVILPHFDFATRQRGVAKKAVLLEDQPIIIEGIHALNPVICSSIPNTKKYKIYIAPQPQVNIDNHTPISMTDMRLLRRIARDSRTRNTDAARTIRMWPSVREGEFKYIYSTQENADFVFDSFLPYELCAIKDIVLPQLEKITVDMEEYVMAHRLKNMIRYFVSVPIDDVPCNSLAREFLGGSSFKDAR